MISPCSVHVSEPIPPPPPQCLQREQADCWGWGQGDCFLPASLQPADSCSLRPGAQPQQQQPGRLTEDIMHPHDHKPKQAKGKKQPQQCAVDSVCPLVLIFAEPVCGSAGRDAHMTHKRADFTGFKSILSNVCFLSGLDCDYTGRMAGLSYCRVTLDHTFSTFFHPGKTSTTCVIVVFQR